MTRRQDARYVYFFAVTFICVGCTWLIMKKAERLSTVNFEGWIEPRKSQENVTIMLSPKNRSDLGRTATKVVGARLTSKNHSDPGRTAFKVVKSNHIRKCPVRIPDQVDDVQPFRLSDEQLTNRSFIETTSAKFTTVEIVNDKPVFRLCDALIIRIVSRDWRGKPKSYGGDVFRLKLYSEKPYSAANADRIIDFNNGTYLVYFTLRWGGHVKLQIKLIHPVEMLPQLRLTLSGELGRKIIFGGEFISNNVSEEATCQFVEMPKPFCNLSNPRTHGPWFCEQPKDPRLKCRDWALYKMSKGTFEDVWKDVTPLSKALFNKSHMVEVKNNCTVFVTNQAGSNVAIVDSAVPSCSVRDPIPTNLASTGHFFNNSWYPNDCKVFKFSPAETMSCLRDKKLIIIGDSTARQIFDFLKTSCKRYLRELPMPESVNLFHGPLEVQSDKYNVSIYFRFHGLPRSGHGLVLRTEHIEYTVDKLDSIESGSQVIIILSLWSHFIVPGRAFYVQRLKAVKIAIQRFLERCPASKVIIKGANTKDHPIEWSVIASSEWNIIQHELELRALFQAEERVGFIDALDITRAQPYDDNIHPHVKIVEELVNKILTYTCKS